MLAIRVLRLKLFSLALDYLSILRVFVLIRSNCQCDELATGLHVRRASNAYGAPDNEIARCVFRVIICIDLVAISLIHTLDPLSLDLPTSYREAIVNECSKLELFSSLSLRSIAELLGSFSITTRFLLGFY